MAIGIDETHGKGIVIVDGVRTPFVKSGGALKDVPAHELGRIAIDELLARTGFDPAQLDEVVLGNCGTPADAANVARVSALRAGVPEGVPVVHRAPQLRVGHGGDRRGRVRIGAGAATRGGRRRHGVDVELPADVRPRPDRGVRRQRARQVPARAARAVPAPVAEGAHAAHRDHGGPDRPGERPQHGPDRRGAGARVRHLARGRRTRSRSPRTRRRSRRGTRGGSPRRSSRSSPRPRSSPSRRTSARAASRRSSRSRSCARTSTAVTARSRSATPARSPTARPRCW